MRYSWSEEEAIKKKKEDNLSRLLFLHIRIFPIKVAPVRRFIYHREVPNARLQLHFPYTSLGISRYHALVLVPDRAHDPHDGTKPRPHVRSGRWRGIYSWIRHFRWRGREPDLDVRPVGTTVESPETGSPHSTRTRLIKYALRITSLACIAAKMEYFCTMFLLFYLGNRSIFLNQTFFERK